MHKYEKAVDHAGRGFTIVELIIVIIVIAVLAGIVLIGYNGVTEAAGTAALKANVSSAASALEAFYAKNGAFPLNCAEAGVKQAVGQALDCSTESNDYCVSVSDGSKSYKATHAAQVPAEGTCDSSTSIPNQQIAELLAADGAASDYFGWSVSLSADGSTAIVGAESKNVGENSFQGVAYIFTKSGSNWSQVAELSASDGEADDYFGNAVALSGDGTVAIVGDSYKNDYNVQSAGAAYIFTDAEGTWAFAQKLTASDGEANDDFGASVSLSADGSTAIVGASAAATAANGYESIGAAYVFVRDGASWAEFQQLASGDGEGGDNFGASVSLSAHGSTAIVGAGYKTVDSNWGQGAAYIFTKSGGTWSRAQELTASDGASEDGFGVSVSLAADGSIAIIGDDGKTVGSSSGQGVTYVFTKSGSTWSQAQVLTASDGASEDGFGFAVSLSADGATAIVGACGKTVGSSSGQGATYVFTKSGGTWSQAEELTASDGASEDYFGVSVSLSADGSTAIVGAYYKTVVANSYQGAAYIFGPESNP